MECKNAYVPKGERLIFCKKSKQPEKHDTAGRMHATCAFQRFCPEVRNCVLLPGWEKCHRLREKAAEEQKEQNKSGRKRKSNYAADAK